MIPFIIAALALLISPAAEQTEHLAAGANPSARPQGLHYLECVRLALRDEGLVRGSQW